jgi:superfamily II DNA or RNA helicase
MDYIPVFVANDFYKNRTEFIRRHVVYSNFTKFPKIDRYIEVARLMKLRNSIIVNMRYNKRTIAHDNNVPVPFDRELFNTVMIKRWNVYEKRPIKDISELCYLMRKVVNSDPRRADMLAQLFQKHKKIIVFYNFNYERDILLQLGNDLGVATSEWTGHKHEQIPETEEWMYIVQYAAGAEGWNCIETDTIVFFSQNYSYKATIQAAGRIDRLNTPFINLYYYYLRSNSIIDLAIQKAFNGKKDFNEHRFMAA